MSVPSNECFCDMFIYFFYLLLQLQMINHTKMVKKLIQDDLMLARFSLRLVKCHFAVFVFKGREKKFQLNSPTLEQNCL